MLELLQFVFSSFWIWLGTVILIIVIGVSIYNIIVAVKGDDDE
jgi:hypothetical protein